MIFIISNKSNWLFKILRLW